MLSTFKNDLPLTPCKLIKWLKIILQELDQAKTFTFPDIAIMEIIAKNKGTIITDICSIEDFNKMYNAVKNGNTIKLAIDNTTYISPVSNVSEVTSDNYKYVGFWFIGTFKALTGTDTLKKLKIGIETIEGVVRLSDKSISLIGG